VGEVGDFIARFAKMLRLRREDANRKHENECAN